jgi:four helix bundle protein
LKLKTDHMSIKNFEDLECWKACTEVRREISKLLKRYPSDEKYLLIQDMRRASRSATHNIAEGYGRFHYKENRQFCRQSKGSLYELLDQLIASKDDQIITNEEYIEVKTKIDKAIIILNGYIKYLTKADSEK